MRHFPMICVLALGLCACTEADRTYVASEPVAPAVAPGTPTPPQSAAAANYAGFAAGEVRDTAKCTDVADQRAEDAAFQGFDKDIQQDVRDRTYASCLAWKASRAAGER
jgi:hypothetical protein